MEMDAVGAPNACALAMFPAPNIFAPGIKAVTVARPNDSAEAIPALETVTRIGGEPIASAVAIPVVAMRGLIVGAPIAEAEAIPDDTTLDAMVCWPLASELDIAAETIECGATAGDTIGCPNDSADAIATDGIEADIEAEPNASALEMPEDTIVASPLSTVLVA